MSSAGARHHDYEVVATFNSRNALSTRTSSRCGTSRRSHADRWVGGWSRTRGDQLDLRPHPVSDDELGPVADDQQVVVLRGGRVEGRVHVADFVHGAAEQGRRCVLQRGELQRAVAGFELPKGVDGCQRAPHCELGWKRGGKRFAACSVGAARASEPSPSTTLAVPVRAVTNPVGSSEPEPVTYAVAVNCARRRSAAGRFR